MSKLRDLILFNAVSYVVSMFVFVGLIVGLVLLVAEVLK